MGYEVCNDYEDGSRHNLLLAGARLLFASLTARLALVLNAVLAAYLSILGVPVFPISWSLMVYALLLLVFGLRSCLKPLSARDSWTFLLLGACIGVINLAENPANALRNGDWWWLFLWCGLLLWHRSLLMMATSRGREEPERGRMGQGGIIGGAICVLCSAAIAWLVCFLVFPSLGWVWLVGAAVAGAGAAEMCLRMTVDIRLRGPWPHQRVLAPAGSLSFVSTVSFALLLNELHGFQGEHGIVLFFGLSLFMVLSLLLAASFLNA